MSYFATNIFEKLAIGMPRDKILLVDHNPLWNECFAVFSAELQKNFPANFIEFFHIGSTSIPQLKAKPILDILGVARNIEEFDTYQAVLEKFGFTWKGEYGIPERRFCVFYNKQQTCSFVHLHTFQKNNPKINQYLQFRNYLRNSSAATQEYERIKEILHQQFGHDRLQYTDGKTEFVQNILQRANNQI